jgi:hypothetical protein
MREKTATYTTIMTKHSLFSFLGLVGTERTAKTEPMESDYEPRLISAVIKLDPREGQPVLREYPTRGEAIRHYHDAVATSVARGWEIIYRGRPLWG